MDKQLARKSTKPFYQYTEFTLGVIIVVLFLIASIFTKNFSTAYNISNLLKQGAITGVLAAVSYTHLDVYKRQERDIAV